ncbi:MAG TPA: ABC transporter permease subunit [Gemmatimonadales bacterium]|jgi:ABC-2 type transport system permease protein
MIRRDVVLAFLAHEIKELRGNARVLPVMLIFPVLAVLFPVILTFLGPSLVEEASVDPAMGAMLKQAVTLPEFQQLSLEEALIRFALRGVAAFYLLMPVAIGSTAAAFSIVGEKQQRTLEPILATPISDREFLAGKFLVCLVPTMVVTWLSAIVGVALVDSISWSRYGTLFLPDRFWLAGIGLLAPLVGAAITLVTMRLSARSVDPQSTVQASALAILPGFFVVFGVFGKVLMVSFNAVLVTIVLTLVLNLWLFRGVERTFRREEILTKWK